MKNIFWILAGLLLLATPSQAQRNELYALESPYQRYTHNLVTVKWLGAMPLGSITEGYVDKASLANYALSLEWVFRGLPLSAGFEVEKYNFEQRYPRSIYQIGDNDVSAVKTSTYSTVPLTAFVKYHPLGTNSQLAPYIQAGVGAHFNNYIDYFGTLADQKKQATIGFGAGAGVKYFIKKDGPLGVDVSLRYDQNTFQYGYVSNGVGVFAGSVGVIYRWW
jgi:hypothetical protein